MVQVDAGIAICIVAPKAKISNEQVGILFGQRMCIDRLVYSSVPRPLIEAKGQSVDNR